MADASKKKAPKERPTTSASAAPPAAAALADHPILSHAVEGFIRSNNNFESSVAINTAIEDIGKCADIQSVFAVPLQHKLFTMDSALRWVLFLSVAPGRAVQEGDAPFSDGTKFSPQAALGLVSAVYDVGVQETVWDHFEPEDDEYEDSGEDDEQ